MNDEKENACRCNECVGSTCGCGCQGAVTKNACGCEQRCADSCACAQS